MRKLKPQQGESPAVAQSGLNAGLAADLFYLQDTRSYVGNDMLFWATVGGYTTDVSKADIFSRETAFKQHACRDTDRPWPKRYIDSKTRPAVDHQYTRYKEAMAEVANVKLTGGASAGHETEK